MIELPDPREQRDRVLDQIERWRDKHRRKPSHLLEVQLAALLRLVDRLDDLIEGCRLERPETVPAAVPGASEAPAAVRSRRNTRCTSKSNQRISR
jgi:hypothetical protein